MEKPIKPIRMSTFLTVLFAGYIAVHGINAGTEFYKRKMCEHRYNKAVSAYARSTHLSGMEAESAFKEAFKEKTGITLTGQCCGEYAPGDKLGPKELSDYFR